MLSPSEQIMQLNNRFVYWFKSDVERKLNYWRATQDYKQEESLQNWNLHCLILLLNVEGL